MSDAHLEAPTSEELTTEHLAAGADRRFYAFVVDCLVAWGVIGGEAYAAYTLLIEPGRLWTGVAAIAGTVLLVWLIGSMLVGIFGLTPGKALVGIRVLSFEDARPIGLLRAMLRTLRARPGDAPDARLRCGRAGLDRDGRPERLAPRLARPADRHGGGRRTPGPGGRGARGGGAAPGRQPHRDAAGPGVADAARGGSRRGASGRPSRRPRSPRRRAPPTVTPRQGLGWPLVGEAPADARRLLPRPPSAGRARARRRQLRRATAPSRARPTPPRRRCGGRSPSTPASSSRCVA